VTNSANPATGTLQGAGAPIGADAKAFFCAVRECDKKPLTKKQKSKVQNSDKPCATLGSIKHACVKDKTKGRPGCQNEPAYDTKKTPPEQLMRSKPNDSEPCSNFWSAWASMRRALKAGEKYKKGRMRMPDFVIEGPPKQILDAKFPCPDDVASGKMHPNKVRFPSADRYGQFNSDGQEKAYKKIAGKGGEKPKAVSPKDTKGLKCK
jgi:hypothetical protein